MTATDIITRCCNKKLCKDCNDKVAAMNPSVPLCPNCRRDLIIEEYIIKNNALNLYDLRIHKRFIPIKLAKTIVTESRDDYGNIETIETKRIPAEYDDETIKYVSKNSKIQKALILNENILFAKNKKHPKKYVFLSKSFSTFHNIVMPIYTPILCDKYKNIPVKYLDHRFIKKLGEKMYYFKDTNIPLIPKSRQFILAIGNDILKKSVTYPSNFMGIYLNERDRLQNSLESIISKIKDKAKIKYLLKRHLLAVRDAQQLQARRIGFQKKRDTEIKQKEERIVLRKAERNKIQQVSFGEFPPTKKIKIGDIHITSTKDVGICAGFNLWKYKSGKILVFKKGQWIVSEKVCKMEELTKKFRDILLKA